MHSIFLAALGAFPAAHGSEPFGERLHFGVAPDTRLHKVYRATHELRVDDMGQYIDDLPFVSDQAGGWVNATLRFEFLDHYVKTDAERVTELRRVVRDATLEAKAHIARRNGPASEEGSRGVSPLRSQTVHYQWIESERDWSRCYETVDGEEELLEPLRGEFDLVALLPGRDVEAGATWKIDPRALVGVLAPGGNWQLTPNSGNLFGRLTEIGLAGDYADFFEPVGGDVVATFKGRRSVSIGEGDAASTLEVGVIGLELTVASRRDRVDLYRRAMPEDERKENARIDEVPLEYSLTASGELLWDLAGGHFHALTLTGHEAFVVTARKTTFDGAEQHRYAQESRFSGPLKLSITCAPGTPELELAAPTNPALGGTKRGDGTQRK